MRHRSPYWRNLKARFLCDFLSASDFSAFHSVLPRFWPCQSVQSVSGVPQFIMSARKVFALGAKPSSSLNIFRRHHFTSQTSIRILKHRHINNTVSHSSVVNYSQALGSFTKDQAHDLVYRMNDDERQILLKTLEQFNVQVQKTGLESKWSSWLLRYLMNVCSWHADLFSSLAANGEKQSNKQNFSVYNRNENEKNFSLCTEKHKKFLNVWITRNKNFSYWCLPNPRLTSMCVDISSLPPLSLLLNPPSIPLHVSPLLCHECKSRNVINYTIRHPNASDLFIRPR